MPAIKIAGIVALKRFFETVDEASLLLQGICGKVNAKEEMTDERVRLALTRFAEAFKELLYTKHRNLVCWMFKRHRFRRQRIIDRRRQRFL